MSVTLKYLIDFGYWVQGAGINFNRSFNRTQRIFQCSGKRRMIKRTGAGENRV